MPAQNILTAENERHHSATISDVASLAGVSIATVSRVINGSATVSVSTAARVNQAITELNFTPHEAARALATKKTHTIGLVLPEISGFYFDPLLRGIENGIRGKGYDLLVHSAVFREGRFEARSVKLNEHNTDGILIFAASMSDSEISRLYNIDFPIILLHQSPPDDQAIACVTIDNKAGAYELVNHLVEVHQCRQIGFLSGPSEQEDSHGREMGYREALSAHGIQFNPDLVAFGGFNIEDAQESVDCWFQSGIPLDSIFASDDDSATGAIIAIRRAGKRVPEDIAVVGFDDIYISQYLSPPLTTVRAPIEEVGFNAALNLIQLIQHEPIQPVTKLATHLMIRRSCGCNGAMN